MTRYVCDRCNRPMLHLANNQNNIIVTLCSKCAEKEAVRDPFILSKGWGNLKVGAFGDIVINGTTYSCEVVKTRHNFVNIKVYETKEPFAKDWIVLIRNHKEGRIDFFQKRFRYTMGYAARDFLLSLLLADTEKLPVEASPFLIAQEVVTGGIGQ